MGLFSLFVPRVVLVPYLDTIKIDSIAAAAVALLLLNHHFHLALN
jgi:hypothetical protein